MKAFNYDSTLQIIQLVGGFNPSENISQLGSFPQVGVKIKDIWNHYPDKYYTFHAFRWCFSSNSFSDFEGSLPETNVRKNETSDLQASVGAKTESTPIKLTPAHCRTAMVSEVPVSKFAKLNPASFLHGFRLATPLNHQLFPNFWRSGFCSMIAGNRNNRCHILALKKKTRRFQSIFIYSRSLALASAHHILYIICVSYLDKTFHATFLRQQKHVHQSITPDSIIVRFTNLKTWLWSGTVDGSEIRLTSWYVYHLESRWLNSHVLVYHGPLQIHLLGVALSTLNTVHIVHPSIYGVEKTSQVVQNGISSMNRMSSFWGTM